MFTIRTPRFTVRIAVRVSRVRVRVVLSLVDLRVYSICRGLRWVAVNRASPRVAPAAIVVTID